MPLHNNRRFAPRYEHDRPMPPPAAGYSREWRNIREELLAGMGAGRTTTPRINNGPGDRHTVHTNRDLRYDRERVLSGAGHPADRFTNYQIQANRGTANRNL